MTGYIIYEEEVARKSMAYINYYLDEFDRCGIQCSLEYKGSIPDEKPDFAIVRTMDPELSESMERSGIQVFNNAHVSRICNHKGRTYQYIQEHTDIPVMETWYHTDCMEEHTYPLILKSNTGHGGNQVFYVKSMEDMRKQIPDFEKKDLLIQKPASDLGRDVRVYVVGNKIVAAMLRVSKTDFRSNYCLGGMAIPYELSGEERRMVEQIIALFDFGMVGIDFVFHHGKMVFNEIEDVVGSRMLYANTSIDIVKMYTEYIIKML